MYIRSTVRRGNSALNLMWSVEAFGNALQLANSSRGKHLWRKNQQHIYFLSSCFQPSTSFFSSPLLDGCFIPKCYYCQPLTPTPNPPEASNRKFSSSIPPYRRNSILLWNIDTLQYIFVFINYYSLIWFGCFVSPHLIQFILVTTEIMLPRSSTC